MNIGQIIFDAEKNKHYEIKKVGKACYLAYELNKNRERVRYEKGQFEGEFMTRLKLKRDVVAV